MADRFDEGRRALDRLDPPDLWVEANQRAGAAAGGSDPGDAPPSRRLGRVPVLAAAAVLLVVLVGAVVAVTARDDREPATAGEGEGPGGEADDHGLDDPEGIGGPCPFVVPGFGLAPGPADPPLLDGAIREVEQSVAHAGTDQLAIEVRVPGSARRLGQAEHVEQLELPRGAADVWRVDDTTVVRRFAGAGAGPCASFEVAVAGGPIPNDDKELAIEVALRFFLPGLEQGAPSLDGHPLDRCSTLGLASVSAPAGWSGDLQEGEGGEARGWSSTRAHLAGPPGQFLDLVAGRSPFPFTGPVAESEPVRNWIRTRSGPTQEGQVVEVTVEVIEEWITCHLSLVGSGVDGATAETLTAGLYITDGQGRPWLDSRGAIWPESAPEQGPAAIERIRAGEQRDEGEALVLAFARELLGWDDAVIDPDAREPSEDGRFGGVASVVRPSTGESVLVWSAPTLGMRWPGVYRVLASPPGDLSVPLNEAALITITPEREVVLEWNHPFVPHEVEVVVGHGEHVTRGTIDRYGVTHGGFVPLDHEPDTTGFVLLLLRDEDGRLVGATGRPIPAGPVERV